MFPRILSWLVLCALPFCVFADKLDKIEVRVRDPLVEYLRQYEGRWVGKYQIQSSVSDHVEEFQVEQQYWMKDGKLRGVSVSQRTSGIESARSETYVEDGKFYSIVSRSDGEERFVGQLHDGWLIWLPADLKRANDYQIKESIMITDAARLLKTEGFDSYVYSGGLAHIIFKGELKYLETN